MKLTSISISMCYLIVLAGLYIEILNRIEILSSGQQPFDILYRFISILYQAVLPDVVNDNPFVVAF